MADGERRRRTMWVGVAAIVVAAAVVATVWAMRANHSSAPQSDCGVVEQLEPKWNKMQQAVAALESGPGETNDLIAVATAESAMAQDIRTAQASVSAPDMKAHLGDWAQGTELTAKDQHDAATAPPKLGAPPPPSMDNDSMRAATLTYTATAALKKACPNLQLSQSARG